ncbi:HYR domain-containing protein, partial [Gardnerella sp. Marseille-Q9181]|uniref:HYR domain-containing protein n=1 Tax=Gardnerella sp. Marseille-Q9181 TaxID=3383029 RepID=UPI003AF8A3A8
MTTTNPSKHTSSKSSRKRPAHKVHTLPLATMAALLTAATCLGSQPAMAVTARTPLSTPTQAGVVRNLTNSTGVVYKDREADVVVNNPEWLKTPSILEFQRYRSTNDENKDKTTFNSNEHGSDEYNTLIKKTDMYAHIETIDGAKYLVFDVFFNNDAQSMVNLSNRQWYIWQVPYQIAKLNSNGSYASDTIRDLRFDAYKLKDASQNDKIKRKMNFTLSRDFAKFEKVDNQSTTINFPNDHEKNFGGSSNKSSSFSYTLGPNQTKYEKDMSNLFHENHNDYAIGKATWLDYPYNGKNYGIGIQTSEVNLAFHMHAAVKLNDTAINEKATTYDEKYANIHNAWTWADSATYGSTTSSSYAWISGRDPESDEKNLQRHKDDSIAPKIYYNGNEITDNQTIKLYQNDKLSFTTTDDKGYIEKFSISGLTKNPTVTQGDGSEKKPLPSGDIKVTKKMNGKEVTITSEDGSGNVTTRKVKVTVTTLADEHPITGKTIDVTVGDQLPKLTKLVEIKDGNKLEKQPDLRWNGPAPKTDTVGVFTYEKKIKGEYSDKSKSFANVTINVKPKKPVIDTDLTDLAGKKGQKVTVSVGSGIPTGAKVTTTVKLFDKNGNEIGSTTTINNGKADITVKDGIPAGDVYATTTVKKLEEKTSKTTTPGFEITSDSSDKKQATAPKDNEKPTITATAESSSVAVGQDLKIHIVAKDDVKVDDVPNAQALQQGLGLDVNELSSRIKSSQTTNTDKEKDFDLTVKNMQPKEVGTHTITFTVKDSAGNTGSTTLTITVKPKAPTVTPQNDGSVEVTPADGTDTLVITYTPENETNPKTITVKKDNDGNWTGKDIPTGVTVDKATGKVTIPADKVKDKSDVTAKNSKNGTESNEKTGKTGT